MTLRELHNSPVRAARDRMRKRPDQPRTMLDTLAALAAAALVPALAPAARAAEPFTIEVVLPLTGAAAFLGTAEQRALQQAEALLAKGEGIGGRPIRFNFHDDQSSPQTAVQLATQIVSAKPAVVLGSAVV